MSFDKNGKFLVALSLFAMLTATSCTVSTNPTTAADRAARAERDVENLFKNQEKLHGPLTLYEAVARAVKYNSAQKVRRMEQGLAAGLADSATFEMLPSLAASAGFDSYNRKQGIYAQSVKDGTRSLEDSYVLDQNAGTADLQVVFNVLDFGVSYVKAKQASNEKFIAEEVMRKSLQRVIHDTRAAFWRAAAAQRVAADLDALTEAAQEELVRMKTDSYADKPLSELNAYKDMLTVLQDLTQMRKRILTAKSDLALLMNLSPNLDFSLDIPPEMDAMKVTQDLSGMDLEHFALVNRPELRISDYEARILKGEATKEFMRYFPGLEFSAGVAYDSNSYLYNQSWASAGVRVTWNLMSLFSRPQAIRLAEQKGELEEMRRLAMTMAVMSQVRVSSLELVQAGKSFEITASLDNVNDYVWKKSFKMKNDAERRASLQAAAKRLQSHLERDFAYAEYKAAQSNLMLALGIDPLPKFSLDASVDSIAQTLEENLSRNAPLPFKEISYDRLRKNGHPSALSDVQRSQIKQWADAKNQPKHEDKAAVDAPKKAPVVPVKKKVVKKSAVLKRLQISSFEKLADAQAYYKELSEKFPMLSAYAPLYAEVQVQGKGKRVRTYLTDTPANLQTLCGLMAMELKSCLITDRN